MTGPQFREGDLLVFDGLREAESGEFAFVRYHGTRTTFCRLFRDTGETRRLQFLRPEVAPEIISPDQLIRAWPLAAHVVTHG